MKEELTETRNGLTITVYLITTNLYAYFATQRSIMVKGSLNAYTVESAIDQAFEAAKERFNPPIV